jgi:LmbE family N-acetylglucosaminyl deacetylase
VELLTVFACDTGSGAPTGGWDGRAGFATEGEAAAARRAEDAAACAVLGVTPKWLPFGSVDFDRHGDEADVRAAVEEAVAGSDVVLLPGFPLTHPDHDWLARVCAASHLGAKRLGRYAEQPYAHRTEQAPPEFELVPATIGDRVTKWRAIRRYRSQLPLLGMQRSMRRGPHSILWEEAVDWVNGP